MILFLTGEDNVKKKNCFLKIDVVLIILNGLNFGKCFTLVIVVCPGDHASNFL